MAWTAEQKRSAYRSDPTYRAKRIAEAQHARKPFALWTPCQRERHRSAQERSRREAGRPARSLSHGAGPSLWKENAKQAWDWWLSTKAPGWWIRAYYRALGKPWLNARLSKQKRDKIRYWLDAEYRARHILKKQAKKERRAYRIDALDDGTLTPSALATLFIAAKLCPYCSSPMGFRDKSLDHVHPLSRGGLHSLSNARVCCKDCNTVKRDRTIDEWISDLMAGYADRPVRESLHGNTYERYQ